MHLSNYLIMKVLYTFSPHHPQNISGFHDFELQKLQTLQKFIEFVRIYKNNLIDFE